MLEVTPSRLGEIRTKLQGWSNKKTASKREVQSLIGKLSFIAKCVRPGRIFLSRMLQWLREMDDKGSHVIPAGFQKDVHWWLTFLPYFNSVRMIPPSSWSEVDKELACDACLTGCGGVCGLENFHAVFPDTVLNRGFHINELELLTLVVAIKVWAPKLKGKRVKVWCDNITAVQALRTGKAKNCNSQALLREMAFVTVVSEMELCAMHIQGVENRLPDFLSRWHLGSQFQRQFQQMVEGKEYKEVEIKEFMFELSANW